jgi:hypothetical protein
VVIAPLPLANTAAAANPPMMATRSKNVAVRPPSGPAKVHKGRASSPPTRGCAPITGEDCAD